MKSAENNREVEHDLISLDDWRFKNFNTIPIGLRTKYDLKEGKNKKSKNIESKAKWIRHGLDEKGLTKVRTLANSNDELVELLKKKK